MFDVIKNEALLGPSDLAKLLKVSRVTVSQWFNGHNQPHHLLGTKVTKVLDAVKAGVASGDFPVPHDVPRRERGLYITGVVSKHLKASAA